MLEREPPGVQRLSRKRDAADQSARRRTSSRPPADGRAIPPAAGSDCACRSPAGPRPARRHAAAAARGTRSAPPCPLRIPRAGRALDQLVAIPDQMVAPAARLRGQVPVHDGLIDALRLAAQELRLSGARASRRPWRTSPGPTCRGRSDARPAGVACPATASAPRPVRPASWLWPRRPSGTASRPGGLSTTSSDASSYTTTRSPSRRGRARTARPLPGRSIHTRTTSPSASVSAASAVAASRSLTKTFPRSIAAVAFEREPSRSAAARNLSSRPPASAAVTVHCLIRTRHHHRRGSTGSPHFGTQHPARRHRTPAPGTPALRHLRRGPS